MTVDYDKCPPNADSMIQSMRAFGYDLKMAVADLIDNSISAGAKNIWVIENWGGMKSYIGILDDGSGMSEKSLFEAMRLGSKNPLEERDENDLGRFGLGLKTASFSQCRLLTVKSKTKKREISTRCWDLDYINNVKDWNLLKTIDNETEHLLDPLNKLTNGTFVLWQKLDRIVEVDDPNDPQGKNDFLRKIEDIQRYLEMVFHRFIEFGKLNIYICNPENIGEKHTKIKPWDPFLTSHSATQELSNEALEIFKDRIKVRPFILPHISKLTSEEHKNAAGSKGWNAQQGFYIYRKDRLIVSGGWLDLGYKQEEHYKLARVLVDIPNNMDDKWKIDVKKAEAHPPDALRPSFLRIVKLTREKASAVYRHRGKIELRRRDDVNLFVWKKIRKRGKVTYKIDRKHPLVCELLDNISESSGFIKDLLKLIEQTVPIEQIVITNSEEPDSHINTSENVDIDEMPIKKWFLEQLKMQMKKGLSKKEAVKVVLAMEPFNQFPELIAIYEGDAEYG
jgi:hypothetical protein